MSDTQQRAKKIVILYSGGLDSFIMNHYAKVNEPGAEVKLLYWKHGCESEASELENLPSNVSVRQVDWLNDEIKPQGKKSDTIAGNIYIPGRNLVFAVLAACQELPDEIWMGTLIDEYNNQATDKNSEFIKLTQNVLDYVLSPFIDSVKIRFPFVEERFTKLDTIQWALNNGVQKDEFAKNISCWNHKGTNCGVCKQCFKRALIFGIMGIEDTYVVEPLHSESGKKYIEFYKSKVDQNISNEDELNVYNMIKQLDLHR